MGKRRSVWAEARRGRNASYSGQFAGRLREMLESPAFRVLSLAAHCVLARLEIELMCHGGNENGRLTVSYRQFEGYGVHKNGVAAAIRELEALGFIETAERGCAGNANFGKSSQYRLTYRPAVGAPVDGSHEWRRIKTMEDARAIQKQARRPPPLNVVKRGGTRVRKIKPQSTVRTKPPPESGTNHPLNQGQVGPDAHPLNQRASSISRSGGATDASAATSAAKASHRVRPERSGMPAAAMAAAGETAAADDAQHWQAEEP
jgi:hypothetical protein